MKKSFLPICIQLTRQHVNQLFMQYLSSYEVNENIIIEGIEAVNLNSQCEFIIKTSGLTQSEIALTCTPKYNLNQKRFEITNIDLDIKEGNMMVKGISWITKKLLSSKIDELANKRLNKGIKELIGHQINQDRVIPLPDAFNLNYAIERFEIKSFEIENNIIELHIELEGNIHIDSKLHQ